MIFIKSGQYNYTGEAGVGETIIIMWIIQEDLCSGLKTDFRNTSNTQTQTKFGLNTYLFMRNQ